MSNLTIFQFAGQQVRTETINDQPYFLLKDVCDILELGQVAGVKRRLDKDVISNHPLETSGGTQDATFINESGLYDVIMDSRKPEAKQFRKWVTDEVIPSIRKHGAYMTPEKIEETLMNPDTIIQLATNLKDEQQKRQAAEQQLQLDKPYSTFGKAMSNSNAAVNIGAFAKMIYEHHGLRIGRNKLFAWLREQGYLIKHGRERNNPKQKYIEKGWFDTNVTLISRTEGGVESVTTLITGKGQVDLANILLDEYKQTST
ncbi:phage antirepressor KilAC domain-containing protein [Salibacterium halotolerans]|uniref:Anti-repressor protein n=1 Tax=Salibacterium halotolerans TaxID=1884432 RepID=A0A1I5N6U4_9BACI|nr:phage antirepressor [Salibacterium halotolerans]SFP17430.1 anti-repressor protein [Salibacterium halotolerans]